MKTSFAVFAVVGAALLFAACSGTGVRVTQTQVAVPCVQPPKAIYIRPFCIAPGMFDRCTPSGNAPIRAALAPREFADDLQEELAKIAPARVLKPGETAPLGWLVEGEFGRIESGYSPGWWSPLGNSVTRRSLLCLHVRVTEVRSHRVIYEFDMETNPKAEVMGRDCKPGTGYPLPFDFRNTAEVIGLTLTPDPFKYGVRTSPVHRY
ncbi:MAG: hypothetical protein PHQ12_06855 [Chthoniobacteraceae bacterium]|nr:hypothetical protein [Chthoniobacteraceae bacterium]